MAKRFGRNARRRFRETEARLELAQAHVDPLKYRLNAAQEDFEREIVQARTAGDAIRVHWDCLSDLIRGAHNIRAKFPNIPGRHDTFNVAINIDYMDLVKRSEIEQKHFIMVLGRKFADYTLSKVTAK